MRNNAVEIMTAEARNHLFEILNKHRGLIWRIHGVIKKNLKKVIQMFRKKKSELDPELAKLVDELAEKIEAGELQLWQAMEIVKARCEERAKREAEKNGNNNGK